MFNAQGNIATGTLRWSETDGAAVSVGAVIVPSCQGVALTIASAVPKGERADWMVEKLSELGTSEFLPLATARAVVLPQGKGKRERWAASPPRLPSSRAGAA